jgi:hypothetical protein
MTVSGCAAGRIAAHQHTEVGLAHEDQDAFCLPHRHLGRRLREHRRARRWRGRFEVAETTYRAAVARWPTARITLRQGARVVHESAVL